MSEDKKNNGGRPKSELDLPKGWQKTILDLYQEGASDVEVKAWIYSIRGTFSNDLWERWMKEEDEFSETIKMGRMLANSWWEKNGRENLKNRDFNYAGWFMNMKNRYDWADRFDNTHRIKDDQKKLRDVFPTEDEIKSAYDEEKEDT